MEDFTPGGIQEHKNLQAHQNKTDQIIDEASLFWERFVKGPTSLALIPLVPGNDQVACHICIGCIVGPILVLTLS